MASSFNSQAVRDLFSHIRSAAAASGLFDREIGHEPKSAPGNRLSYAIWLGPIAPIPQLSGLAATAGRVVINARVYAPFLAKPEDDIETNLMHAVTEMIAAYSGEITIGGTVYAIDLLGAYGVHLGAENVGYIEQDGTHYRVAEITIPVIIDALWTQVD